MAGLGYAVIDFETTGLFPGGHDRVIEVAVVHVNSGGAVTGQWDTLVNPARDLGPQHIHGIRSADVLHAPTFADIAPRLVELLSGRVIVAHNASFDIRFLNAELARAGYVLENQPTDLCTMRLAREFLPGAGRSLKDCCDAYGIELEGAHRASVDAFATAQLLEAYIVNSPMWNGWSDYLALAGYDWPPLAGPQVEWVPRGHRPSEPANFLERISVKLPEFSGPAEHLDYLALLDRALLDRHISAHEANELVALAESMGISRTTCEALHSEYFDQLTAVAWSDGVLSTDEMSDLIAVGSALSIPSETISAAMQKREATHATDELDVPAFLLAAGDLLVLTGDMQRSRDDWHAELTSRGYVPWTAVTKKVKLLAAADPDSLSGKARKARDYGIPIVGEDGLTALLKTS
jgi:DNA polymerase-3 subunit epsilon